jgi:hypothetical protein
MIMARHIVQLSLRPEEMRMAQKRTATAVVHRIFGWKPQAVRTSPRAGLSEGVCLVHVQVGMSQTFVFWVSGDHLVNIPPKYRN